MRKKVLALLLVGILLLLAACGTSTPKDNDGQKGDNGGKDSDKVYTLKLSTSQTEQSLIAQSYMKLADRIDEATDGRLKIEVFASSQLGNDEDVIEQAIQGDAVAVNTDAARMGTYVKDMGILMMGYFADDYDEILKVTESDVFAEWEKELAEKHGIKVLAFNFYDGPRHFMTNKEINSPEDLKGLRIRTIGAEVTTESIAAMGATPIAMAWGEVYNGIQSKAIDGAEAQNTSTLPSRLYETTKYQTKTGHFQLLQGLITGVKWFEELPEDLQEILVKTAREVGAETAKDVIKASDEAEKEMEQKGLIVNKPDLQPFKTAVEAAYDKLGYTELRNKIYEQIGKTN